MEIVRFCVNDEIELKKPHPCGSKSYRILRVGSDMRIVCLGCGHDIVIDRIKLEKALKRFLVRAEEKETKNEQ